MRQSDVPADGPGHRRLIDTLFKGLQMNWVAVGWTLCTSPRKPANQHSRVLEEVRPERYQVVLFPGNHKPADGPLERTLLHAQLHCALLLDSRPAQERVILTLESLLWPALRPSHLKVLRKIVQEAKQIDH